MEQPEFYRAQKSVKKAQSVVILAQSLVTGFWYNYGLDPAYRLVAYEPETGCWWKLPPIPEFEAGYVWRRGANMPGGHRWFFGCAADGDGTIYVAGGYDVNEDPLNSAWAYHVSTDTWTKLPDMAQERGYCKGLFHLGKFHVINGSATDMQGHHQSLEIFDTSSRQWLLLGNSDDDDKIIKSPKYCVQGTDLKLYTHSANTTTKSSFGVGFYFKTRHGTHFFSTKWG
ncbi:F-box/kelch-repeat protein-like protein [Tanacetum coccineum]